MELAPEIVERICISLASVEDVDRLLAACPALLGICTATPTALPFTATDQEWAERELRPHPQLLLSARTRYLASSLESVNRERHGVYMSQQEWCARVFEAVRKGPWELLLLAARCKAISVREVVYVSTIPESYGISTLPNSMLFLCLTPDADFFDVGATFSTPPLSSGSATSTVYATAFSGLFPIARSTTLHARC